MRFKLVLLALLAVVAPLSANATDAEDPNYTTQNLMIFNDQDQLLLQRNFMGWSTPGTRYDKRLAIEESLADLARTYGLQVCDIQLSGLFSYRYSYTPAISTRSHYSARLAGGSIHLPSGFDELRWVDKTEALELMASASQKAPPALIELTKRMVRAPDRIWGGAFFIWQEEDAYLSRVLQPLHVLGYTAPAVSSMPTERGPASPTRRSACPVPGQMIRSRSDSDDTTTHSPLKPHENACGLFDEKLS